MDDGDRQRMREAIDAVNAATKALTDESRRYASPVDSSGPLDREPRDRLHGLEADREAAKRRYLAALAELRSRFPSASGDSPDVAIGPKAAVASASETPDRPRRCG